MEVALIGTKNWLDFVATRATRPTAASETMSAVAFAVVDMAEAVELAVPAGAVRRIEFVVLGSV